VTAKDDEAAVGRTHLTRGERLGNLPVHGGRGRRKPE